MSHLNRRPTNGMIQLGRAPWCAAAEAGASHEMTLLNRIASKVTVTPDGCWIYRGKPDRYNKLDETLAHRWVYEFVHGPIEPGVHLHHECEKPACINPWHLSAVTPSEHAKIHTALRRRRRAS